MFALVDANNFYASCERVFRPDLWNRPIAVLSNNDGNIIARTNDIKPYVPMGAALHQFRGVLKKHQVTLFSANYALYGDLSARVMATLQEFSPMVSVYSIDEAFIDFSGIAPQELLATAAQIRTTVLQATGIPVSIGIAATKTLAKVAGEYAKKHPDGVYALTDAERIQAALATLDVAEVWGIGSQLGKVLALHGITTALALSRVSDTWVKKHLHVTGLRTAYELRGVSCLPLEEAPAPRKGIMYSRAFGRPIACYSELQEAMAEYLAAAARKARRQGSTVSVLQLFVQTNPFQQGQQPYHQTCTVRVPQPTNYPPELLRYALSALQRLYVPGLRYHRLGIFLTGFAPERAVQLSFASEPAILERQRALMEVVDAINARFGRGTIKFAAVGLRQAWKAKQQYCSPRYTTVWSELPALD